MSNEKHDFSKGLAGVIADETQVSQVQGEVGRLIYRGISIEDIAEHSSFEEVSFFLLKGHLPNKTELDSFVTDMKTHRTLPEAAIAVIKASPRSFHPMTTLQAVIAFLAEEKPVKLKDEAQNIANSVKLISQLGTAVALISRHRRGLPFLEPKNELSHAENFLYMIFGKEVSKEEAKIFDVALILHADHDFNASTFSARVVASTEAKLGTSISSAIGALSGPLHGGANERVLAMADEVGSPEKAKDWVMKALAEKRKIMGFGHRMYRTMDPRAKVLRKMFESLVNQKGDRKTYDILTGIHDTMIEELGKNSKDYIWPNVDFWSGGLYKLLGLELIDFTPIFAVSRTTGWCSHIIEMWRDNRIYRPSAKYIGPVEEKYIEISKRK